jgi:hypothetical protein
MIDSEIKGGGAINISTQNEKWQKKVGKSTEKSRKNSKKITDKSRVVWILTW